MEKEAAESAMKRLEKEYGSKSNFFLRQN